MQANKAPRLVGDIPGVKDLETLVQIIKDTKRFEKALKDLDERKTSINHAVSVHGDIQEITRLKQEAADLRQKSQEEYEAAQIAADEIVKRANDYSDNQTRKMAEAQEAHDSAIEQRLSDLTAREDAASKALAEAEEKLAASRTLHDEAKAIKAEAAETQNKYQEKLAALQRIAGT